MNFFKLLFNWKYYSSILDRMEEEYKIIVEIREFLENRKFNLNIPNIENDIRRNDYNKIYLIIDIILELEETLKRQQNEINKLQYLNNELTNYINNNSENIKFKK